MDKFKPELSKQKVQCPVPNAIAHNTELVNVIDASWSNQNICLLYKLYSYCIRLEINWCPSNRSPLCLVQHQIFHSATARSYLTFATYRYWSRRFTANAIQTGNGGPLARDRMPLDCINAINSWFIFVHVYIYRNTDRFNIPTNIREH